MGCLGGVDLLVLVFPLEAVAVPRAWPGRGRGGGAHRARLGGGASLGGWSGARLTGAGLGRGEHGGASGPGVPSCALRARHCSWDCSFRGLLGPRRLASSEQSAGLWTTGKGTRTRRSREPCLLPFVCSLGAD